MEHSVLLEASENGGVSRVKVHDRHHKEMTHGIPNVSQITISPACSLGTAEVAYGRRESLVHELEEPPQSKGDHRGKRGEQRLSEWDHDSDVAASRSGWG
jgi:hypothetical protein